MKLQKNVDRNVEEDMAYSDKNGHQKDDHPK